MCVIIQAATCRKQLLESCKNQIPPPSSVSSSPSERKIEMEVISITDTPTENIEVETGNRRIMGKITALHFNYIHGAEFFQIYCVLIVQLNACHLMDQ